MGLRCDNMITRLNLWKHQKHDLIDLASVRGRSTVLSLTCNDANFKAGTHYDSDGSCILLLKAPTKTDIKNHRTVEFEVELSDPGPDPDAQPDYASMTDAELDASNLSKLMKKKVKLERA